MATKRRWNRKKMTVILIPQGAEVTSSLSREDVDDIVAVVSEVMGCRLLLRHNDYGPFRSFSG